MRKIVATKFCETWPRQTCTLLEFFKTDSEACFNPRMLRIMESRVQQGGKCLFDDSIKGVTDIMNRLNILFSLHSFHASDHFNLCVYPTYLWGYSGS